MQTIKFLPPEILAEVINVTNRIIGGKIDYDKQTIVFWQGGAKTFLVPFSFFRVSDNGITPDFNDFSVIDYGHGVKFGNYEASTEFILNRFYGHDRGLQQLREHILLIIDMIIEKEGAFGMTFGKHEFEARWKSNNEIAYQRNEPFGRWSFEECLELLTAIKDYIESADA